jgi:hypothetical protein
MCKKYFSALFEWRYLATITTKQGICELVTFSQAIFAPWQVKNTWYSIFNYI